MILLKRLEDLAKQNGFFSEMQLGFQEGVGCIEASFFNLDLKTTICWNEGVKFSVVFSMFEKPLTQFGLMVCYTNYSQNLKSEVEYGWLSKIYTA